MKRSICVNILVGLTLTSGLTLSACSREGAAQGPAAPQATSEWTATPAIATVTRTARGLQVSGVTEPQGRVVLRSTDDRAYGTGSDQNGRFSLAMPAPAGDALFSIEGQRGELTGLAPQVLLVAANPAGPAVLLAEGAPSRRLDVAGPLDTIDSDGRAVIASGRAAAGTQVEISVEGRAPFPALAGADGRWSALLSSSGAGAMSVTVGGRRYDYPGPGDAAQPLLAPSGAGWRATRRLGEASWQSAWLPAAG